MTIPQIENITNILVICGSIPVFLFTIVYGIGSPWYKSWLGRNLLGLMLSFSILFAIILLRRFFGDYPGFWLVALVGYLFLGIMTWCFFIMLLMERRAARPLNIPLVKKDTNEEVH